MHEKEIIHGDVGAHNILVQKNGLGAFTDFDMSYGKGLEEIVDDEAKPSTKFPEPAADIYRAPEVQEFLALGKRNEKLKNQVMNAVDYKKADVFSFGMTLIEICQPSYFAEIKGHFQNFARNSDSNTIEQRKAILNQFQKHVKDLATQLQNDQGDIAEELKTEAGRTAENARDYVDIGVEKSLMQIAARCISSNFNKRPSSKEVQQEMGKIKNQLVQFREMGYPVQQAKNGAYVF